MIVDAGIDLTLLVGELARFALECLRAGRAPSRAEVLQMIGRELAPLDARVRANEHLIHQIVGDLEGTHRTVELCLRSHEQACEDIGRARKELEYVLERVRAFTRGRAH